MNDMEDEFQDLLDEQMKDLWFRFLWYVKAPRYWLVILRYRLRAMKRPGPHSSLWYILHGKWYCGMHTGGDKWSVGRTFYDGYWYYLNFWPFWINVHC